MSQSQEICDFVKWLEIVQGIDTQLEIVVSSPLAIQEPCFESFSQTGVFFLVQATGMTGTGWSVCI
jgi:hypothetical protein